MAKPKKRREVPGPDGSGGMSVRSAFITMTATVVAVIAGASAGIPAGIAAWLGTAVALDQLLKG